MEIIEVLFVVFSVATILFVEIFAYSKKPSSAEIEKLQIELDETSENIKKEFGVAYNYNAKEEIEKSKKSKKAFLALFAGVGEVFVFFILLFFTDKINGNAEVVITLATSAIVLILYGFFKLAENKLIMILVLAVFVLITWVLSAHVEYILHFIISFKFLILAIIFIAVAISDFLKKQ